MLKAKCDDPEKSKDLTDMLDWNQFILSTKGLHPYIVDSVTGVNCNRTGACVSWICSQAAAQNLKDVSNFGASVSTDSRIICSCGVSPATIDDHSSIT